MSTTMEFIDAAKKGDVDLVRRFLAAGVSPNCGIGFTRDHRKTYNPDMTPLLAAAEAGHSHVVRLLLSAGANPNLINDDGCSVLTAVVLAGHEEVVRILLDADANPNIGTWNDGFNHITALMIAAWQGHAGIVRSLLKAGARFKARDDNGNSVMFYAKKHKEVIDVLKELRVDILV